MKRHDVNDISQFSGSTMRYNTAGAVVSTTDPLSHQTAISYAESFSDGNNSRNTLAYPTTVTDAEGFSSHVQYNFDFGARTRVQGPPPAGQPQGLIQTLTYDEAARIERVTTTNNGAYTRYLYGPNYVASLATVNSLADEAYSNTVFDGLGRVTGVAGNHSSSGGYKAQLTQYDLMGRAKKQSNPTEITGLWVPAGDDVAGWLYTRQTYDWQGRPLVTTNTDDTTKEASYSGCGCAGGEVVTLTDEGTMDAGVFKRRQQKIYSDVLGRAVKTEVFNWQGGTVYSATVNTYNARDQITQVRQYAGAEGSGTYQDTTMTYDGFGRLKTKHVPEQNAGSTTTWDYNSDDTIQKVTDARGAIATYGYNSRHLLTSITYSAPAGITPTQNVSYGYDAAGNRTSMTDGMGSLSYGYDQLSRLTSETRTFSSLGTYPLTYAYNLAGGMTSMTDPFGARVNYNFDGAGQIVSVTGSGFAGVSTFASNIQYRAWGDQKSVTYGDNKSGTTSYDGRMRPSTYEFPGLREQFQYYDDSRLKQMTDLDDRSGDSGFPDTARHFSRALSYDHVGRLTVAKGTPEATFPFNQNYAHDAFNNPTSRFGTYYYQSQTSDSATYSNNRRQHPNWTYHADGQVQHSPLAFDPNFNESVYRDWSYDAAGRMVQVQETVTNPSSVSTYTTSYDGDGQAVRESTTTSIGTSISYLIRSSVLGGRVFTRLDSAGAKQNTSVNVDGRLVAVHYSDGNFVSWTHIDPLGLSEAGDTKPVYDPMGKLIPWQQAPSAPPNAYPPSSPSYGGQGPAFGSSQNNACTIDGTPISCDRAMTMLSHGSAAQCRNNNCGPTHIRNGNGNVGWAISNGSGYWISDGHDSLFLSPDDVSYGSQLDAYATYFQSPKKRKRTKRSVQEGIQVKYPPVTASEINLVVMPDDKFRLIQDDIVDVIVDISNRQACSDAFKRYGLKIPYDVVKSGKLRIAGLMALNQPNAGELLEWTPSQVDKARATFEWHWYHYFRKPNIGEGVYAGIPTIVFNAYADFKQLGGLREVVTHAFIHVGGKRGDISASPHDLGNFNPGYKEIIDACK